MKKVDLLLVAVVVWLLALAGYAWIEAVKLFVWLGRFTWP